MQSDCLEVIHRYQGYLDALAAAGLPLDETLVVPGGFSGRSGYEAVKQLLARNAGVDAVFAISDVLALGAMEALREVGLRVPEDVALAGFDNIPQGAYVTPPLTTVSQNLAGRGVDLLVEKLIRQIEGNAVQSATIPHQLLVRRSSGVTGVNR